MQVGVIAQEAHPAEVVLCRFCAAGSDPLPHSSHCWDGQGEREWQAGLAETTHRGENTVASLLHVWICELITPFNLQSKLSNKAHHFSVKVFIQSANQICVLSPCSEVS